MTVAELVARNLRDLRREAGLTQRGLARAMRRIGAPMSESAVARIEAGYRDVTLDEMFALARALLASPATLLAVRPDDQVTVGDSSTSALWFALWLDDGALFDGGRDDDRELEDFSEWPAAPSGSRFWANDLPDRTRLSRAQIDALTEYLGRDDR